MPAIGAFAKSDHSWFAAPTRSAADGARPEGILVIRSTTSHTWNRTAIADVRHALLLGGLLLLSCP
ncbi:hypothetical protein BV133_1752 [Blastochloris viridis]|uniref:Uncharacterized protein n=1 Tax=Blastochloris viridis TaxID=1079 RepID=A0A182D1P1_BLAVI|nr:hypothetical protein BV133_1752 [Blastochloris viridis]